MSAAASPPVVLGAIAGAHGVRGEIKVKTFTAEPADIAAYGPLVAEDGTRRFTLKVVRVLKRDLIVARAPEIKSREEAQGLAGVRLCVSRDALPALDDEDEFYIDDLVGLEAVDEAGAPQGRVAGVYNFGAGDIIELKDRLATAAGGARPVMIAFTKAAVPSVDIAAGRLVIAADALAGAGAPRLSDETGEIVSDDLAVDLDAMREEDA